MSTAIMNNAIARRIQMSVDYGSSLYDTIMELNNFLQTLQFLGRIKSYDVALLGHKKTGNTIEVGYTFHGANQVKNITRVVLQPPVIYADMPSDLADSLGY